MGVPRPRLAGDDLPDSLRCFARRDCRPRISFNCVPALDQLLDWSAGSDQISGKSQCNSTGRTLYYRGQKFQSLKGTGFKSNYYNVDTGEDYWISGPKRGGREALYGGSTPIEIDEDVREEYWLNIRRQPKRIHERVA